jgi:hypothetical protein
MLSENGADLSHIFILTSVSEVTVFEKLCEVI